MCECMYACMYVYMYHICIFIINIQHAPLHSNNTCFRFKYSQYGYIYYACPESKDTTVLNMYNIFNLQKRHCERIACT